MKKITLRSILVAIIFSLITGCNFYEIDKSKYFRSAQLTGKQFEVAIKKYGIKSIINLRGADHGADWYKQEIAVANKFNIAHVDIGMSPYYIPHRENLIALLDAFRDLPRPILLHCKAGADRTGEASAIYKMIYMGASKKDAMNQQTLKFGHIEQANPGKRYFIGQLWQGEDWARNYYDPCTQDYKYYDRTHCGKARSVEQLDATDMYESDSGSEVLVIE